MSRDIALSTLNLSLSFGGNRILSAIDLNIDRGSTFAIIGPNGAGKTSLFNVLTRLYQPDSGAVVFENRDLLELAPSDLAGAGIFRTFQNLLVLKEMSVLENVLLGLHTRYRRSLLSAALALSSARSEERAMREQAEAALDLVGLLPYASQRAGSLPFGHQRLLELARCVAARPSMILLDEPSAGMTAEEVGHLMRMIDKIRRELGPTVLLIAHTMNLVLGLSDRIAVLHHGAKIADGAPSDVMRDAGVIEAYLGRANHA